MTLDKREGELYQRNEGESQPETLSTKSPGTHQEIAAPAGEDWGKTDAVPTAPPFFTKRGFKIGVAVAITFGVLALGGYMFLRWWETPGVVISVEAPFDVRAGERYEFGIVINNSARQAMERISLVLRSGSGVLLADETGEPSETRITREEFDLILEPDSTNRQAFYAYFLGKEGEERQIEITLRYYLADTQSPFSYDRTIAVRINAPAAVANFNLPSQALSASDFALGYEVRNLSTFNFSPLSVRFDHPRDFDFVETRPAPIERSRWQFQDFAGQDSVAVEAIGRLTAAPGEVHNFRITLYARVWDEDILIGETTGEISVIENPMFMSMSVNGAVDYIARPGEVLEYRITFKNNFQETLRDVVIVVRLSGNMFNLRTIETVGAFNSRDMTITFHGGNDPQLLFLGPQESGSVTFTIETFSEAPGEITNPIISAHAEMTSATEPRHLGAIAPVTATAEIETRVSGAVLLSSNALLRDPVYGGRVVGPWPLRTYQTTQMSVHLGVAADTNDLEDILVSTTLPAGVRYIGNVRGDTTGVEIIVNPRISLIELRIPRLKARESRQIIFQIEVTPSVTDLNQAMLILQPIRLTGRDSFTGKLLELEARQLNSVQLRDPTITNPGAEGRVRE